MAEHLVRYVARVTKFLDRMIQEHGDYLFLAVGFACFALIVGLRKGPVQDFKVTILPFGIGRRRFPEPLPLPPPSPIGEPPED